MIDIPKDKRTAAGRLEAENLQQCNGADSAWTVAVIEGLLAEIEESAAEILNTEGELRDLQADYRLLGRKLAKVEEALGWQREAFSEMLKAVPHYSRDEDPMEFIARYSDWSNQVEELLSQIG